MEEGVRIGGKVIAVKENVYTGVKLIYETTNLVTNDGDKFYAEIAVDGCSTGSVTNDFTNSTAGIHLGSGTTGSGVKTDTDVNAECTGNSIAGRQVHTTGYPRVGDTDADNTGDGVDIVTWLYSYTTTEGNVTKINEGAIVDSLTGASAALTHWDFGSTFDKTSADTLKIFVNHTFLGA
jgi:flagellin-like hook-associated protein FlgL